MNFHYFLYTYLYGNERNTFLLLCPSKCSSKGFPVWLAKNVTNEAFFSKGPHKELSGLQNLVLGASWFGMVLNWRYVWSLGHFLGFCSHNGLTDVDGISDGISGVRTHKKNSLPIFFSRKWGFRWTSFHSRKWNLAFVLIFVFFQRALLENGSVWWAFFRPYHFIENDLFWTFFQSTLSRKWPPF